ncbi:MULTISPECIES: TIGR04255 family protein [unclassified Bradyrhizobium]|uniref:TIGR04255 family protein n=1 Tax=unclassified Bradyrhizobium TaxID=2631580 RepID=UPI002916FDD5|nr:MULTISPECIES: TIGR04255 family protein [unclassified Bradyrhizobium]
MTDDYPKKLKHDAIIEVSFEIRFDLEEGSPLSEVILGRLADAEPWRGFVQRRLPAADIPAVLRRGDPNLKYQAAIQLIGPSGREQVAIGPNSVSFTRTAPYPGWNEKFRAEVQGVTDILFRVAPRATLSRLGLRYVNTLRSIPHGIAGIESLNLRVTLDGAALSRMLNVNYTVPVDQHTSCTVRIASVDLAQGVIPEHTTCVADLDVYTIEGYTTTDAVAAKAWCEVAHAAHRRNFFKLLTKSTIENLRAD